MTDAELVAKKLASVETCCRELRDLARPERVHEDIRERRFVEHAARQAPADLERFARAVRERL